MSTTTLAPTFGDKYNDARFPPSGDGLAAVDGSSYTSFNSLSMATIDKFFLTDLLQSSGNASGTSTGNRRKATLISDQTATYFQTFDTNFTYSGVLYSGVQRSTGTAIHAGFSNSGNKLENRYEQQFMPNYDGDGSTYTADVSGTLTTFEMRGKFSTASEFSSQQRNASGVIEYSTLSFKDGITESASGSVDMSSGGFSGVVTQTSYNTFDGAFGERNSTYTNGNTDASQVPGTSFDPKDPSVDAGSPTDDFSPPSSDGEDSEPDDPEEEEEESS